MTTMLLRLPVHSTLIRGTTEQAKDEAHSQHPYSALMAAECKLSRMLTSSPHPLPVRLFPSGRGGMHQADVIALSSFNSRFPAHRTVFAFQRASPPLFLFNQLSKEFFAWRLPNSLSGRHELGNAHGKDSGISMTLTVIMFRPHCVFDVS